MIGRLKELRSLELEEPLSDYFPEDPSSFGTWIRAVIGAHDGEGGDSFDILLCTPEWLKTECSTRRYIWGHPLLVVDHYNYEEIKTIIARTVGSLSGKDWDELAGKIGRLAEWEFHDYVPHKE